MCRLASILIALSLTLAACSPHQVGKPFDIAKADDLEPGVSTESDAKRLLGEPESSETNVQDRHKLLVWQYITGRFATAHASTLAISFDADGRMVGVTERDQY